MNTCSKFSVKIFKLLVGDLSDHLENALASAQDDHNDIDSGAEETDEVFIYSFKSSITKENISK